ncbi:DUF6436 domain-containing protein [Catenovulum agarivorans]|uniref:DUF6436 domain-containing protein n=1 Tax=Catenovulum agarivorans TaxID=1172192 RepID=UPI001269830D|nr:DUF6436 domain-containing protein [Catenovulum agarivorans]
MSNLRMGLFDPNNQLTLLAAQSDFEDRFVMHLTQHGINTQQSVVHFYTQNQCYCQSVADLHIDSVVELAQVQGYDNIQVELDQSTNIATFIPSTPAVAVFNQQGRLVYFGPYATGLFCAPQQGIVEDYIGPTTEYFGPTIITDAQGCYCYDTPPFAW